MLGYTKIFSSLVTSTIWQEPNDARVLWITILALREHDDVCRATIPALAKMCDISIEDTEKYLKKFQEPDRYSRSQDCEGRRLEKVDGGYLIINAHKYKELLRTQERRDYFAERKRLERNKKRNKKLDSPQRSTVSTKVTESETETETKKEIRPPLSPKGDDVFVKEFESIFWPKYPKKIAKPQSLLKFVKARREVDLKPILAGLDRDLESEQWRKDGGQFIPNPTTWLNQRRWESSVEVMKEESWGDKWLKQRQQKESYDAG